MVLEGPADATTGVSNSQKNLSEKKNNTKNLNYKINSGKIIKEIR